MPTLYTSSLFKTFAQIVLCGVLFIGCTFPIRSNVAEVVRRTPEELGIPRPCFDQMVKSKGPGYAPSSWSVAVVKGDDLHQIPKNLTTVRPVISAREVRDRTVRFTADPFLIRYKNEWFLFFEIMNCFSEEGDIAYATSSDGVSFEYKGVALDEHFHLSYPHVFHHAGEIYMTPESRQGGGIRLYKATSFPHKWELVKLLVPGDFADPSLFYYQDRWWIFAVEGGYSLAVYYADSLEGPYTKHSLSPLYRDDKSRTRPGGRVIVRDGKIIRFSQDNKKSYGHQVRAFNVTRLTTTDFEEVEESPSPFLTPSNDRSWRGVGMHHIDPHQLDDGTWMAAVDGAGVVELIGRQ